MKHFIRDLRKNIKKQHMPEKRIDGFHPSSLGSPYNCTRKYMIGYIAKKYGVDIKQKGIDPTKTLIFSIGHSLHDIVRDQFLGPAGYLKGNWVNKKTAEVHEGYMPKDSESPWKDWTYEENRYRDNKYNIVGDEEFDITGAVDGVIVYKDEEMLLDIKTINQYWWNRLDSVSETYQVQLMFYMYLTGYKKGAFLYVNKNTAELKTFIVEWDQEIFDKFLEKSVTIPQKLLLEDKVEGRIDMCSSKTTMVAKGCDYCDICFSSDTNDLNVLKKFMGI